jgi:nitrite reductase/ring-hydroxylating ferredoxin subunit
VGKYNPPIGVRRDTCEVLFGGGDGCTGNVRREVTIVLARVGSSKDVPSGQMRVFDVAGSNVSVASVNGRLYAFDDSCTHAGCSLAGGILDGTTVTCPCHGSRFDVTSGAVLRGPAGTPVRSRLVQVEGEELLVEA